VSVSHDVGKGVYNDLEYKYMALRAELSETQKLSESEIQEMAELSKKAVGNFDEGFLTKSKEQWVLVTRCWDGSKLRGWLYSSLERIGGTPSFLLGPGYIEPNSRADSVLKTLLSENYKKALLAFPDEDLLVGARLMDPKGFAVFKNLSDVLPRFNYKPTGEERAWGRRLAKRFGLESCYDDRSFTVKGNGEAPSVFEFSSPKAVLNKDIYELFKGLNKKAKDTLIVFGWAMAEDLLAGKFMK